MSPRTLISLFIATSASLLSISAWSAETKIDVVYAGGRAKGTASTPDPSGKPKQVVIDTVVADGTIDDNAVQALLPALKWKPDAKWTINVLSAGQS